ncbi:MAG: hypothetical protein J0I88_09545 [Chryseobacterium sp.]|nr:hypothetical protein [Chryseobacterium sp.]
MKTEVGYVKSDFGERKQRMARRKLRLASNIFRISSTGYISYWRNAYIWVLCAIVENSRKKMKFKQIDIQKFDSTGNYVLNEEYILSYGYSDGWTERSFNIAFFIDIYFDCKIDLSFCLRNLKKKNGTSYSEKIEKQIESQIPIEIKNLIVSLINLKELKLKYLYADTFMEDSENEHFVINHNEKSHNIGIGILLKKVKPENESENLFLQLHIEFKKWKEDIYKKILSEI